MKRKTTWEMIEPPPSVVAMALRRLRDFGEAAILLSRIRMDSREGLDFIETLSVSCYLQGIADLADGMHKRTEGAYEEER